MDNTYDFFALFIKRSFTVRVLISTAVLAVFLFTIPDVSLAQTPYILTDLGTLGGAESRAVGINDFSQVVGRSEFEPNNDNRHAFLWDKKEGMIDLGTLGGRESLASDINKFGQVVGGSYLTGGGNYYRAFVWDLENGMEGIGSSAVNYSFGRAINDAGHVVGYATFADTPDTRSAFLWGPQDGMQDLGTLGGEDSRSDASGINRFGQVVGSNQFEGGGYQTRHAVLWQDGEMTDLGILPGGDWKYSDSSATDINDSAQLVGWSKVYSDPENSAGVCWLAFLWEDGEMVELGTLGDDLHSMAIAINNTGQAVGWSRSGSGSGHNAVLWNDGEIHNLNDLVENDLGIRLAKARGINNHGQIVGTGYIGGNDRAFLLTPVPEPASLVSACRERLHLRKKQEQNEKNCSKMQTSLGTGAYEFQ